MSNWYKTRKEADIKQKIKNLAVPALIGLPLGVGLGFMNNGPQKAPAAEPSPVVQTAVPTTKPTTQPATQPTTAPSTQPTTKPAKPKGQTSNIVEMLKDHEGYDLKMYPDSEGIPTIGIGFNLQKPGAKERIEALGYNYDQVVAGTQSISDAAAMKLFQGDLATARKDIAAVVPDLSSHPQAVQDVLTDMMFNMGINRLSGFKNMLAAVNAKDYAKAADEMENSKWFGQVARRGPILVKMMRSVASQPTSQPAN